MATIVDQYGNPISTQRLTEPQTARIGTLYNEFDTHPVRGITPSRLARLLEDAEQGDLMSQADLAEDMEEKDGHLLAEIGKRKRAILTLDWDITPPRDATAKEEADTAWVKEVIEDINDLEDLLIDLLDAILKGYSCAEITWALDGREWLPERIEHRPARWFTIDRETRMQLRVRTNGIDGEPLQPFGWITHIHKAKSGYIARGGLVRTLVWPFLFKNYAVRDLAEFLEIYGLPLRLGTYPNGASDEEKATLLRAVANIGHAAAGIIPEGMLIEFKEAAKGNKDPFEAMIDWCERTTSKAILGGTLTSQADGKTSTNALGNVHNEVRHDLLIADARQLASTLTRDLIYPLLALNKGIDSLRRCPKFVFDTSEPEDLALYAEAIPKLTAAGVKIPESWVHDRLKIPQAEEGEDVIGQANPEQTALKRTLGTGCPVCAAKGDTGDVPPHQIGQQHRIDRLGAEMDPLIDELLAIVKSEIERAVAAGEPIEAFRERLTALIPTLSEERMTELLRQAFIAANAAGIYDASGTGV